MNSEQIAEIRARVEAATPGPWAHDEGFFKHWVRSDDDNLDITLQELHPDDGHETPAAENAEFIAHARDDVPALLDALAERDEQISQLQQDLADVSKLLATTEVNLRDAHAELVLLVEQREIARKALPVERREIEQVDSRWRVEWQQF